MLDKLESILRLDFQGYWHVGSGKGEGHYLDAECVKNDGLPYVTGRQLKGLLRHAVYRAEAWGWYKDCTLHICGENSAKTFTNLLFGSGSQSKERLKTLPGMITVDNAMLIRDEYEYLSAIDQASLRQYLYKPLYSTKINYETGSAEDMSLRGIQVALPVCLYSELIIDVNASHDELANQQMQMLNADLWHIIEKALPLVDAVGAYRSRGLGEVTLSLVK